MLSEGFLIYLVITSTLDLDAESEHQASLEESKCLAVDHRASRL